MTTEIQSDDLRAYLIALALLLCLGLGYFLWDSHIKAGHAAEVSVRNAVTTLEARIDGLLRHVETALDYVIHDLTPEKLSRQSVGRYQDEINTLLALYSARFPEINSIRVIDANGDELYRSRPPALPNIADRDYFRYLNANPQTPLHFSNVVISVKGRQPLVNVSKPVADKNGRLRAIVFASLDLHHLEKLFSALDLGKQGLIALRRAEDGRLVVRWPAAPEMMNQPQRNPFGSAGRDNASNGTARFVSNVDNIERLFAFRSVGNYPFRVTAAVATDDYLADWRRLAAISSGVLALMLWGIFYSYRRIADHTAALEAANADLESFAYSAAHDLRTPLRAIDGYSRLLLGQAAKLDDEGRGFLQNIVNAAQHMSRLLEDLLVYSRLQQRDVQIAPVNSEALVESLLAERAGEVKARGVAVSVTMPLSTIKADCEGLTIALRGLLDNAIKFTAAVPQPTIEINGRVSDATYILSMRDNGTGFDMKYHDKIFDIFQRLNRSEDYPGTGVGLAIVRRAMQRMGGRVWAESAPGKGATFYLELSA